MAEIDPNTAPSVMPAEQAIAKADGRPTTAMLNWFSAIRNYTKKAVVDLTTKITTLVADIGDLSAAITEEATIRETEDGILASRVTTVEASSSANSAAITAEQSARISGDSALATSITTVDAKANAATASGAVYLAAMVGPGGSSAAYGWHLAAGNAFAGMQAIALSGGGSAIAFTADKFLFTDSGTAQQVLDYNGSAFVFQVPIVIQSASSGARTVISSSKIEVYDGSGNLRVAIGVGI